MTNKIRVGITHGDTNGIGYELILKAFDNLDIFDFTLTEDEMAAVNALPQRPYYQVPDEPPAFVTTVMDYSRQA